jgi:hypothetical protein
MSKKKLEQVEDWIFEAGRSGGLTGVIVQGLVLGTVGSFYIVGSLAMQAGRGIGWLRGKTEKEEEKPKT